MAGSKISAGLANFAAKFQSRVYRDLTASLDNSSSVAICSRRFSEMLHHVFSCHSPGEDLLEIGSGPGVRNLMSASAKYRNITVSDPVPANRRFLEQYWIGDDDDVWTEHYKLTTHLEGNGEHWTQVRDRIRSSIRGVLDCDILSDEPLGSKYGKYDCVMAILCLEAASKGKADYEKAMANLVSLTKPGGSIVLGGVLGGSFYENAGNRFHSLPVTPRLVRQTSENAGCTILELRTQSVPSILPISDMEGIYMMSAKRV